MAEHQPKEVREMMIEDDLVARLRERDSSVFMDGAANWVIARHLGDPSRPGQLVVHLPWQADVLLIKAANEIERLNAEVSRLQMECRLLKGDEGEMSVDELLARWDNGSPADVRRTPPEGDR